MTTHTLTTGDSTPDHEFPDPGTSRAQIASGAGSRFALAGAKCERQLPARYGPAPEVSDMNARRGRRVPVITPGEGYR